MNEIVSLLTGRVRATARGYVFSFAVFALLSLLLLTAYVALVYALAIMVAERAGPVAAALSVAGGSCLVALVLWLGALVYRKRMERRRRFRQQRTTSLFSNAALSTAVPMMVRASPMGSLLIAGAVAYVLSRAEQDRRRN